MCAYPPNEGGVMGNTCNHYTTKEGGETRAAPAGNMINQSPRWEFLSFVIVAPQRPNENSQSFGNGCWMRITTETHRLYHPSVIRQTRRKLSETNNSQTFLLTFSFLLLLMYSKQNRLQRLPECEQSSFRNCWCWWSSSVQRKQRTKDKY